MSETETAKRERNELALGTVLEQSRTNARQIEQLGERLDGFAREVRNAMDRISGASAPNMGNMAAWAMVVLSIVALVGTPIAYHFNSAVASQREAVKDLDLKLQREYQLINEGQKTAILELDSRLQREFNLLNDHVKTTADALTARNIESHKAVVDRVSKLESWSDDQIKSDLNELRKRRMGDLRGQP